MTKRVRTHTAVSLTDCVDYGDYFRRKGIGDRDGNPRFWPERCVMSHDDVNERLAVVCVQDVMRDHLCAECYRSLYGTE